MPDRTDAARAVFPLSAAQLPLWLIDSRPGKHVQQVEGCALRMLGQIDAGRLRAAIDGAVRRHPALRIGCEMIAGQPRQRVHAAVHGTLTEADFSSLAPEKATARAACWAADLGAVPFDLADPPLWRAGLARLPSGQSLLTVAAHHLICDGWTLRLLLGELSDEYRTGEPAPAEPSGVSPYPQCLLDRDDAWRRDAASNAYWRSVLDGCVAPRVVVPRAAPADGGPVAAVGATVDAAVSRRIREVARKHRVTVFLAMVAAYAVTIGRLSGASRVPVASVYHGRTAPELKQIAGLFATMFVLPVDLSGDPSAGELLARVRQTYRACLDHGNVALEELTLDRKITREPYFRHVLSYHPASFAMSAFGGLPAVMDLISAKPAPNELEFHVRELAGSFALQLRFDPAVLDAGSARTVLGTFGQLLADLAADSAEEVVTYHA